MKKSVLFLALTLVLCLLSTAALGDQLIDEANVLYQEGKHEEAYALYLQAAEAGDPQGMYCVATLRLNGEGIAQSDVLAMEWYQKAADLDHADSLNILADACYSGSYGMPVDLEMAFSYYLRSARQYSTEGMFGAAYMYNNGLGVDQDAEKALEWYQKAAMLGDVRSMHNLALMYEDGTACTADPGFSVELLKYAAQMDHVPAILALGLGHLYGYYQLPVDPAAAFTWYQKAADLGNAEGMCRLAALYAAGSGVEQDRAKAAQLYQQSADLGDAEAQFQLGILYWNGDQVEQNTEKAISLYQQAAGQNHGHALKFMGDLYAQGNQVEANAETARDYYLRAQQAGVDVSAELDSLE